MTQDATRWCCETTEDQDHKPVCGDRTAAGTMQPLQQDPTEYVDHPQHYGGRDNPYEAIKVIEAWNLGFCLGNTVKYISRAGKKGDVLEDLKKARWYLDRQIANMEHYGQQKS